MSMVKQCFLSTFLRTENHFSDSLTYFNMLYTDEQRQFMVISFCCLKRICCAAFAGMCSDIFAFAMALHRCWVKQPLLIFAPVSGLAENRGCIAFPALFRTLLYQPWAL